MIGSILWPGFVGAALLALFAWPAAAAPTELPFDFGMSGRITITKATSWMDGGSVSVSLQDEHGHEAHAGYRSVFRGPGNHGGQFDFRAPGATELTYFPQGSANQRALQKLLQAACIATYGTAAPEELDKSADWSRYAMASILRKLDSGSHPKLPGQ
jgi:hypothetical protein